MRYQFSDWTLDLDNYLLFKGEYQVQIRPKTFKLLEFLVCNSQRLVSREEIMAKVWQGRCVCDDSLTTSIKELRKILGDTRQDKHYILTRHGLGYQFVQPVKKLQEKEDRKAMFNIAKSYFVCPAL